MRGSLVGALLVLVSAGCGGSEAAAARVDRCADRMLATSEPADAEARRYVEKTYCERFEREGWIYADGALSIDAHTWLLESGSEECGIAEADGRSRTVPCEQLERAEPEPLDCALLRHVRRDEVRAYVDGLGRPAGLACDDGTPLDELGVPSR